MGGLTPRPDRADTYPPPQYIPSDCSILSLNPSLSPLGLQRVPVACGTCDGVNPLPFLEGNEIIFHCLFQNYQSSWLQIRRPGFDSWHYQGKRKVVGLGRGPLSLVSTTEELLGIKVAAPV
jgi:hypothetical protein